MYIDGCDWFETLKIPDPSASRTCLPTDGHLASKTMGSMAARMIYIYIYITFEIIYNGLSTSGVAKVRYFKSGNINKITGKPPWVSHANCIFGDVLDSKTLTLIPTAASIPLAPGHMEMSSSWHETSFKHQQFWDRYLHSLLKSWGTMYKGINRKNKENNYHCWIW